MAKKLSICFLGVDGAGKSTLIAGLMKQSPIFNEAVSFHLKPIYQQVSENYIVVSPHGMKPYGNVKSYLKLLYFVFLYNLGWFFNVYVSKVRYCIFDRYIDDIYVDPARFRYGGKKWITKLLRYIVPRPDVYFVLLGDPELLAERKKEIDISEVKRMMHEYAGLVDNKRYYSIDVDQNIDSSLCQIIEIIEKRT